MSNGIELHPDTIAAEEEAGDASEGIPAGFLGPVIPLWLHYLVDLCSLSQPILHLQRKF